MPARRSYLDAAGSAGSGSVTNNGTLNLNFGGSFGNALTSNGTLNLTGGATMTNVVTNNGTMNVNARTQFNQAVHDNGSLVVKVASVFVGNIDGNGSVEVDAGGTTEFASISGNGTFTFGGGVNSTAQIDNGLIAGTIKGFTYGDIIDLRGIAAASATLGANNVLTLKSANGTTLGTLNFDPAQTGMHIGVQSNGAGGTKISAVHTSFTVGSAADIAAVITSLNVGGADYSSGTAYTITFTGNITLTSQLPFFTLGSGSSLVIDGAGFSLNGGTVPYGILDNSAVAAIKDLSISDPNVSIYIAGTGTDTLTLSQTAGHAMIISGVIVDEGHGSVVIGGGTVTFTSANTYSGGTTVAAGATLNLAGGGIRSVVDNGNITLEQQGRRHRRRRDRHRYHHVHPAQHDR